MRSSKETARTWNSRPGDKHELRLLRRLRKLGVPTVAIFLSGRPLWVNPEINASDAFVAAWLPGSEGEGIADLLFRGADGTVSHDFRGRLSFSWPRTAMPVKFDESGEASGALFARGAGLDYRSRSNLGRLPEDPQIPPQWRCSDGQLVSCCARDRTMESFSWRMRAIKCTSRPTNKKARAGRLQSVCRRQASPPHGLPAAAVRC